MATAVYEREMGGVYFIESERKGMKKRQGPAPGVLFNDMSDVCKIKLTVFMILVQ